MHPPTYIKAKYYGNNKTQVINNIYGKYGMAALIQFCQNTSTSTSWYFPSMPSIATTPSTMMYPSNTLYSEFESISGLSGREHIYVSKSGFKIYIRRDGTFDIFAPDNAPVEDFAAYLPKGARLLDHQGRVITFDEPNGVISLQAFKNSTTRFIDIADPTQKLKDSLAFQHFSKIAIPNTGARLLLPNDVVVKIDAETGAITIDDSDRKVYYEAAPRSFNRFLNASDVLEDFIRYLGSMAVRQRHVMKMPLGLFINWLIIAAAEADGEAADDLQPKLVEGVQTLKAQPRCLYCKRFIAQARHERGINFCSSTHMDRFMAREDLVRLPRPVRRKRLPVLLPPSATYFEKAA